MTVPLTGGDSVTVKSSVASSPSIASASATDTPLPYATSIAVAVDSFLPSDVQIAPVSVQVSGSVRESVTVPVPDGVTVKSHSLLLPVASAAAVIVPPVTPTALRI